MQQHWQQISAVGLFSLVTLNLVGHQEAFLSLNEVVHFEVENAQANHHIAILCHSLVGLEMLEGFGVGLDALVPHLDFVVAATKFAVYFTQVHHHAWVLLQVGDSLAVIGSCPLVFHLGLFAVRHEETPLCLCANIDEAILFLVMVEEILEVVDFILFDKVKSKIEMFFDEEAGVAVCVFVALLRCVG